MENKQYELTLTGEDLAKVIEQFPEFADKIKVHKEDNFNIAILMKILHKAWVVNKDISLVGNSDSLSYFNKLVPDDTDLSLGWIKQYNGYPVFEDSSIKDNSINIYVGNGCEKELFATYNF